MSDILSAAYFPGCTLKTNARCFEDSALAVSKALGIKLLELSNWNCCGTVHSLDAVNAMLHLAAVRNLVQAEKEGAKKLVTLCSMCYNTLQQARLSMFTGQNFNKSAINEFLGEDSDRGLKVAVFHLLQLLGHQAQLETLKKLIVNPLKNVIVAPFYGCLLLRPRQVAIDDPENPTILATILSCLGARVVDFPLKNECCGAYQVSIHKSAVARRVSLILESARSEGAGILAVSCPLCHSNLVTFQDKSCKGNRGLKPVSILYFSELMAEAMGLDYSGKESSAAQGIAGISK